MLRGLLGGYARGRRQTSSATLSLNFLAGINDSRITYSGGANGTRVNSAGVIVAATTPRFDYNPVTLAARGLLVEEARTNLRLYSGAIDNVTEWGDNRTSRTGGAITAPDGTASGCLVTADGASNSHYLSNVTGEGAGVKCNSIFAKAGTQQYIQIAVGGTATPYANFDLSGGTATAFGAGTTAGIESYANGWYRCWMATTDVLANGVRYAFVTSTAAARLESNTLATNLYLWGAGCEAVSTFPTSYIPTTTASVTRTADSAVMTGTNFSSWYNQSEGTFVAKSSAYGIATESPILAAQDNPLNDSYHRLSLLGATQRTRYQSANVTVQADISPANAVAIGNQFTAAFAYAANDFAACLNAGTVVTDSSGTVPIDIAVLAIGSGGYLAQLNGHIQFINYYPRRMADSQLQTLTA